MTFRGSGDDKPEQESTKSETSAATATSTSTANPFKDKNVFSEKVTLNPNIGIKEKHDEQHV